MTDTTPRHALPLIQPGQAQKELSHNEALTLIDLIAQPSVVAVGLDTPPADPAPGQCWIVGAAPTDAWSGHGGALAGWTGGGWRFAAPVPGMIVRTGDDSGFVRWNGADWVSGQLVGSALVLDGDQVVGARAAAIPDPAGGASVDSQARATLGAVLAVLRGHGLIAT